MASYRLPTFNLTCSIWHDGADVQAVAADLDSQCNLVGSRPDADPVANLSGTTNPLILAQVQRMTRYVTLLLPKLTDVRGTGAAGGALGDVLEVPKGSGRFYLATMVDDIGKGFANEHRFAYMIQLTGIWRDAAGFWANTPDWPYPTP